MRKAYLYEVTLKVVQRILFVFCEVVHDSKSFDVLKAYQRILLIVNIDFHVLLLSYVCDQVSLLLRESFIGSFPYRDRAFMKVQTDKVCLI